MKRTILAACLIWIPCLALAALEISQGKVRLSLHESIGRFSLYGLTLGHEDRYEPFFSAQDPRTSFLAINMNDRIYRLGESSAFRFRLENGENPAFVFESSFLLVRQEFSFIKTAGSSVTNGIQIKIRLTNKGPVTVKAGFRLLIDTNLGEGDGKVPFLIESRSLSSERIIGADISDRWWISRNEQLSLMGSIVPLSGRKPDSLHFANWKRLNDVPWKSPYSRDRNFNYLPYSIDDSAVCYYYEPASLSSGGEAIYIILLATEDPAGFIAQAPKQPVTPPPVEPPPIPVPPPVITPVQPEPPPQIAPPPEPPKIDLPMGNSRDADMTLLRSLISRLDQYISGEITVTEEELAAMELTIARLKARYSLP